MQHSHWFLLAVEVKARTVWVIDSLAGHVNQSTFELLLKFLKECEIEVGEKHCIK